ncbi:hypothetical protein EMCG_02734 [[Emmonsia] crescens]|uniref:Restriction of telomere capping protein 4 n=1 Tax=[Emmonsia] crescens TaxID=73230 RepID=A0A0G2J146_9EURO|nr:hypothetical protein EMCG_02734 [Emmonsia crescens UAMH 3008]
MLHKAGYYGSRGDAVLLDHVMLHFGPHLGDMVVTEPLVANYDILAYAHEALVPELLLLLVKEDLNISEADAARLIDESTEIGDIINEEE